MKKLKDFNNEIEAREYFGEEPFEYWKKDILKGCIEAEKLYQLNSDFTPESWLAIYNANVIKKIQKLLDKKEIEVEEKISKIEQIRCDEMLSKQREEMRQIIKKGVPHGHQKRFLDKLKELK